MLSFGRFAMNPEARKKDGSSEPLTYLYLEFLARQVLEVERLNSDSWFKVQNEALAI